MKMVQQLCPICSGSGRRDKPELRLLDATCTSCGWHYTSRRKRRPKRLPLSCVPGVHLNNVGNHLALRA